MKKREKERNLFIKGFKDSWSYILESRKYIWFVVLAFFLFVLIGFFIPAPPYIVDIIKEIVRNLLEKTAGLNAIELVKVIFFNNLLLSLLGLFLGIILGIIPLAFSIINGYVIGFICKNAVNTSGFLSLWKLFPHGIFELPAVFISLGLGIKLGMVLFFQNKKIKDIDSELLRRIKLSCKVFIFVVVPLLVIAAIIESALIALI